MYDLNLSFKKIISVFLIIGTFLIGSVSSFPSVAHAQSDVGECENGIDDDGDGAIDYPNDTDCFDYYGSESAYTPPAPAPQVSSRSNDVGPRSATYRVPGVYEITAPAGVYKATIKAWGAGGGGGTGQKVPNHNVAGFGGGGGGYSEAEVAVLPGTVVKVIVGQGGFYGEGGGNSEGSISGVVVAGAGGGGGGVSVGGPGYKESKGFGFFAAIVLAVVGIVMTAGALSGIATSLTTTAGSVTTGAVAGTAGVTGSVASGVATAGISAITGEALLVLPTYTVTASALSGAAVSTAATTITSTALTSLAYGASAGLLGVSMVNAVAQGISARDPRKPGGVDGLHGLGFGGVRGGPGSGKGGTWTSGYSVGGGGGYKEVLLNFFYNPLADVLAFVTMAKQAFAQSWQPVFGTGGTGYSDGANYAGANGGPYSFDGDNPDASSGGNGANGGAGGSRGRLGRTGDGHCASGSSSCSEWAKDGGFPGGGGGGSDTGVGGYGGDGQVVVEFSGDGISPVNIPGCRDGIDNDGDTLIDYPLDPGCTNVDDDDESDTIFVTANTPPSAPNLNCSNALSAGASGTYQATSNDSDGDALSYIFSWSDGGQTSVGPIGSGQTATANKSWATTGTKTVQVTVSDGRGGSVNASCSTVVTGPMNAPIVSVVANPTNISSGGSTSLTWDSINATSCIASGGWTGAKPISGTQSVTGIMSSTTFTLTCTGPDGSASDSVTVTVGTTTQCSDGLDNDNDGLVDMADPGCSDPSDTDETDPTAPVDVCENIPGTQTSVPDGYHAETTGGLTIEGEEPTGPTLSCAPDSGDFCPNIEGVQTSVPSGMTVNNAGQCVSFSPQCSDGVDNDADGRIDFPADAGCANANDDTENTDNPVCTVNCSPEQCSDGIDNDGDGLVDLADGECAGADDNNESVIGCQGSRCNSGGNGGDGTGGNVSGFTVSGSPRLAIQFLANLEATSQVANLSINPVSGFSSPVTLSVESIRTANGTSLPADVIPTYYFDGSPSLTVLMSYNSSFDQYTSPSGTIGTSFAVKLSKKITEKYYITIMGTSGSRQSAFVIELNPNAVNPDFREI